MWLPIRPQSSNPTSPSIAYTYTQSTTLANAITTTTVGPSTSITAYTLFDGLGQPVQTQAAADAGGGAKISDTAYDAAGRVVRTNNSYWTTTAPSTTLFVPTAESQIPSETVTSYDGVGRVTATILDSFGTERYRTSNAYLGADRIDFTPPSGDTPTSTYANSQGQKTALVQYLAAIPSPTATQETTTYSYDVQGKMAGMIDPAGNHWSWNFDVLGHQIIAVDPDTGTTTSTYDNAGNQLTSTDNRGQTLSYTYDELNRKTGEYSGANATTGILLATWAYDTLAKGLLTSSSSYVGSTPGTPGAEYTQAVTGYNAAYQPSGSTVSIPIGAPAFGGTSYTTAATYNQGGAVAQVTEPAMGGLPSEKLKYKYTSNGDILGLSGISTILSTIDYTATGQVSQYSRTGGAVLDYSNFGYDPATRAVKENLNTAYVGTTAIIVADELFNYDDAGNVTEQKTSADSIVTDTQCYAYDKLRDLTAAWTPANSDCAAARSSSSLGGPAPYWTDYTVDPATGNRVTAVLNPTTASATTTTDTYAYPTAGSPRPHAVQSVVHTGTATTTDSYDYDASGGTTARPGQTLSYDATGKLSTVTADGVSQSNIYDASGALLFQSDASNGATLFLGDTELHLAAGETVASAVRTYAADGTPVAERVTTAGVSGSVLKWLVADQQNNTTAEVDATTGAVTRRYADPYGNSRGTAVAWSSAHGFLNAPTSALSSLTLLGAREYDPSIGKFLSVDAVLAPLNPQQNNGYSYSTNNPVTMSDATGLCANAGSDSMVTRTNCVGMGISNTVPKKPSAAGKASSAGAKNSSSKPKSKLDPPAVAGFWGYSYSNQWYLGQVKELGGPGHAMDVFKAHPEKIFPFPVTGCSTLKQGDTCHLTAPTIWNTHGDVRVSVDPTTVRFTVMSDDYFASRGSTITFTTSTDDQGRLLFHQTGETIVAKAQAGIGVGVFQLDLGVWSDQASKLRDYLKKTPQ